MWLSNRTLWLSPNSAQGLGSLHSSELIRDIFVHSDPLVSLEALLTAYRLMSKPLLTRPQAEIGVVRTPLLIVCSHRWSYRDLRSSWVIHPLFQSLRTVFSIGKRYRPCGRARGCFDFNGHEGRYGYDAKILRSS